MKRKRKSVIFRLLMLFLLIVLIIGGRYLYILKKQVEEVNKWQETVGQTTEEYGISEYGGIVMAIILTETKGNHIDLMQSSESKYGTTNQITTSEESIHSGVAHLAEVINESESQGTDIWTAVQAYNFGSNYISFISERGNKNTIDLAEEYSRDVLAPMLGNNTGKQYRYMNPQAFIRNRGYLYENGGNFFYADIVKWNMSIMKMIDNLPF
ncbi:lysozyme family protein [Vagococcus sp. BWB3-3]|uniref:Lysozyme family protein n=1 Tax=Vagococcus allomyrinae TaxID=2794353 RepID=A0A940PEF3_9ENTE|nr:lysozyme family protein [Vagococcus allomyrinae]MBP1044521.1 lysozyme family protein [Vagococcus allomyrinae]